MEFSAITLASAQINIVKNLLLNTIKTLGKDSNQGHVIKAVEKMTRDP